MTDRQLAGALAESVQLQTRARAAWTQARAGAPQEAAAALAVVRLVTPTIKALEQWLALRAVALSAAARPETFAKE